MDRVLATETKLITGEVMDLLQTSMFLIPNWKWVATIAFLVLGYLLFLTFQYAIKKIRISKSPLRRGLFLNHFLDLSIEGSTAAILSSLLVVSLLESIDLPATLVKYLFVFFRLLISYNVIRLSYFGVDALGQVFADFAAKTESTIDDQLAPIATKTLKVLVVVMGILIILQNFGVNVTALLAGLGIGGVAIAFAAQDTVANLFGTITILLDTPFKLGDLVRIGETEGVIEEVGFRSTRVRTAYNSVVVFPNSTIAKEKIDNLGERPLFRFRHNLGLHYDTSPEKIIEFTEGLKYLLTQFPQVEREKTLVVFNGYLDSALNILVVTHYKVKDASEELLLQEKILHDILKLSKSLGVEFAYPTRMLYLKNLEAK